MQQLNYYTLQALVAELAPSLRGSMLAAAFSQAKDELVLGFTHPGGTEHYLRMGCRPQLPYLVPVPDFKRARSNVADVFPAAVGTEVLNLEQVTGERLLLLTLSGGYQLVLKLHGGRSNALLLSDSTVHERFRDTLEDDAAFRLPAPTVPAAPEDPTQLTDTELRRAYPAFDQACWRAVEQQLAAGLPLAEALQAVLASLQDGHYYVSRLADGAAFWLIRLPGHPRQPETSTEAYTTVSAALQDWLRLALGRSAVAEQKAALSQLLTQATSKAERSLASVETSLAHLTAARPAEELANCLMAYLHAVPPGAAAATVPDVYRGGTVTLQLKPQLSPQANAEALYAKHKETLRKQAHLAQQLTALQAEVQALHALQTELATTTERKALQAFAQANVERLTPRAAAPERVPLPYHVFYLQGFEVRVGKDAKRNDELTQRYAQKDDLWLHAKDVPGSHVVVRRQPGVGFPEAVVELAAGLAAWHSKRRTEGLVPVAYTPRKYVRKTKHLPPGQVLVEREDVVLVEPLDPATLPPEARG